MIKFDRILFPVDFSEQCTAIVPAVKAMARKFHSTVTALHVVDLPTAAFGAPESAAWAALINTGRIREEGGIALDRFIAKHFSDFPVVPALEEGEAARMIADYSDDNKSDLIMLPTHGYGPFRTFLLGSVTAKVLHDSDCPVWTGVHAEQLNAHPPQSWKQLLCALDTDPRDLAVLKWATDFASTQNGNGQKVQLRLVHSVQGATAREVDPSMYEFLFDIARDRIAEMQAQAGTSYDVCLLPGDVGRAVHQAATGHNADLIIIGRGLMHKALGRLRSSSYSIIRQAPCPVISI